MQCKVDVSRVIECPKRVVGRILGEKGKTLEALMQTFGANIHVNNIEDPARITIAGQALAADNAAAAVRDLIDGGKRYKNSHDTGGSGLKGPGGGHRGFHGSSLFAQIIIFPILLAHCMSFIFANAFQRSQCQTGLLPGSRRAYDALRATAWTSINLHCLRCTLFACSAAEEVSIWVICTAASRASSELWRRWSSCPYGSEDWLDIEAQFDSRWRVREGMWIPRSHPRFSEINDSERVPQGRKAGGSAGQALTVKSSARLERM